ncbi:LysR family transcriptional regulator [Arthrobacter sp. NtRootA1]|uniref:LysR family transcriptional regulator n=1 Tax=Arthrobacter sp. NtRootA1 TaxID=2830983 RepID=UPI001CC40AD1|nr:LysR family transcriptional regulator [Arthrobacter sp. NtRootA1]BCW05938.1 LysR family transcriptional regulator [Arthrobacter sp. NtRootA1]
MKGIDLNLVPLLQVLLEVRNVSRAAEQLQISQPAASTGLARLRRHFDDELLLRVGRKYELTPFARSLVPLVDETMQQIRLMSGARSRFDPTSTERAFRIVASGYSSTLLIGPIRRILREEAPHVSIEFVPLGSITPELAQFSRFDLLVAPADYGMPGSSRHLFRDSFVAMVSADNPVANEVLTLAELASLPHVVGRIGEGIRTPADLLFDQHGLKRNLVASAAGFNSLPLIIEGTDLIALVPQMLATKAQHVGIRTLKLPLEDEVYLVESMFWHPAQTDDPANTWLRSVVQRSAAQLPELFQNGG